MVVSFAELLEQILSQQPEMDNRLDQLADDIVERAARATATVRKTFTNSLISILHGYFLHIEVFKARFCK